MQASRNIQKSNQRWIAREITMKKLLVFTAVVMVLGSAWAQLPDNWWDAWVTIAGQDFHATEWDPTGSAPTYLGTLPLDGSHLQFESIEGLVWCEQILAPDKLCIHGYLEINGQGQGIPWWYLGASALNLQPQQPDYTYSFLGGPSPEWGPVLQEGDEVTLMFQAEAASPGGDGPLGAGGNKYHATFDVGSAAPIPEPATLGLLGLGALALALRRKRRS